MSFQADGVALPGAVDGVTDPSMINDVDFPHWVYTNWTYNSGTGVWTPPNPAESADLIVNNTFAAAGSWVLDGGWSIGGGVLTHAPGATGNAKRDALACGNKWVKFVFSVKRLVAQGSTYAKIGNYYQWLYNLAVADGYVADLCAAGNGYFFIGGSTVAADLDFDDVYLYPYTDQAEPFLLRNYGAQYGYSAAVSLGSTVMRNVGIVAKYSDDSNLVLATLEGRISSNPNINIFKKVAGTYSLLAQVTAGAYTEWNNLQLKFPIDNDHVEVWYGPAGSEAKKGGPYDVSTVPAGTYAGGFGACTGVGLKTLVKI